MAKVRAVGQSRPDDEVQAQQIPLRWRVAKPKESPVVVQSASASTVAADPAQEIVDYYRDRAESFRRRPKGAADDGPEDERLF